MEFEKVSNLSDLCEWISSRRSNYIKIINFLAKAKDQFTVKNKLHPLISKENEFRDIVLHADEMSRDVSILIRSLERLDRYNFGPPSFVFMRNKARAVCEQNSSYAKKWNGYMAEINQALSIITGKK